ncbi:PAS domain S-box protein [Desertivirga arenae]|uniref:PAS domain S-box protein n=1 Tax=Desertivirga arenae TaxID=2810309 RepID=UPI001A972D4F|nr:PAS domain S-box protein [Pedobacter sp. SYSU D00823]
MNEENRLKKLRSYRILDTLPEDVYDNITKLASFICKTPVAIIAFIDEKRYWIKSQVGLDGITEVPRSISVCQTTIYQDTILEVQDLKLDSRFSELPNVKMEDGTRFYAGCPLITEEGVSLGTLCVNDYKPRQLSEEQRVALQSLAREVVAHLEFSRKNRALKKALKRSRRFEELFNNSNGIHCITDNKGFIEFINSSVTEILGYTEDEMLKKRIWNYCSEGEKESIMPGINSLVESGKNRFSLETIVISKSGIKKWISWSGVVKNNKWLLNGTDISRRKENEARIKTLSVSLEKAAAGVVIRNAAGEIEWLNAAAEGIIGYKLEELEGRPFGNLLIGSKTDLAVVEQAKKRIEEGKPYELEMVLYRKDKTPVWVFTSTNPLFDENGKLDKQVSIVVDISDRKQAEEQLIKTREDAIKLSKAKESFLSVMSHEMRTPLNAVVGMTRILKQEDPLDRQKKNLEILEFSAQNLLTLINDVLDFTKIETGNLQLESVPVEIERLAAQTIESLQFKTDGKNLNIKYELDPVLPKRILGDSTRLYQIFMNLLGNAVKFTEEGEVKLSMVQEKQTEEEVTIRFEISDTGIGIPANKLKSIFDAYTQADTDTARKYGGTGLGLTITKKLIALHSSSIQVESELGKGTRFYFTITFPKVKTLAAVKEIVQDAPLDGNVLVVDDNQINRILARKVLERWNLKVDFAENGLEAINKIKEKEYRLILMDVHMPVMDGLEATEVLRSMPEERFRSLPVIALTGSVMSGEENKYFNAGMNDYVLKPFEPSMLYKKIYPFLAKS